jgi:hypothetical protein
MTLKQAFFILRHGSAEGNHKYLEAVKVIEDEFNLQREEVERLADRSHKCIYLSDDETTEYCVDGPCPKFKTEAQIRAEAVKEFAERVKEKIRTMSRIVVYDEDIDNLVKEFTEGG